MDDCKKNKVVFFYPSKVVGGAEYLFYRMAKQLVDRGFEVSYIDYEKGFIANKIKTNQDNINVIKYNIFNYYKLEKTTTLIVPLSFLFAVPSFFRGDFKVFLWSIHPKTLEYIVKTLHKYSLQSDNLTVYADFMRSFIQLKGLYFMDLDNFYYQNKIFDLKIREVSYLPIPCPMKEGKKTFSETKKSIDIGWLGRLSSEKRYSVANIIDNCNRYLTENQDEKINLHIIGEGDYADYLKSKETNDRLSVFFVGTLVGKALDDYLLDHVEVMFAMGTSALEASALRIPTVILDHSLIPFDIENKFRFLYESDEFSLGNSYEEKLTKTTHSFQDIVEIIKSPKKLKQKGEECYSYFIENHSESRVTDILESALKENQLTHRIIKSTKFSKFTFLQRLVFIYSHIRSL